jgi:hypothetical protein
MSEPDFRSQLAALQEPTPMTLEEALAAPDPVTEIVRRIGRGGYEAMSGPERVFWSVASFVDEVMNEGLEPALDGMREVVPLLEEFARRYGPEPLRELIADVAAAAGQMDPDCLDALTERFFEHEDDFTEALVALASNNREAFDLATPRAGKGG